MYKLQKHSLATAMVTVMLLITLSVALSFHNRSVMEQTEPIQIESQTAIELSNNLYEHLLAAADRSIRAYALTKANAYKGHLNGSLNGLAHRFDTLRSHLAHQAARDPALADSLARLAPGLAETEDSLQAYHAYLGYLAQLVDQDSMPRFLKLLAQDRGVGVWTTWDKHHSQLKQLEGQMGGLARARYERAINLTTWLQVVLFGLGAPILGWALLKMKRDERRRQALLAHVDDSNRQYLFAEQQSESLGQSDEVILNRSIAHLKQAASFVKEIANGNFAVQWEELDQTCNTHTLAGELVRMRDQMQQLRLAEERRNWANAGLAHLGELLRQDDDMGRLADRTLAWLVKYLRVEMGILFGLRHNHHENPVLVVLSGYAFERKKFWQKEIQRGEGLTGQAWAEGQSIYLKQMPANTQMIGSGLGQAQATNMFIVPLKTDQGVNGVIELSSFRPLAAHEMEFVEKAASSISLALTSLANNLRTQQLLRETSLMAEQLRAQEEEMRQNMEELIATQEHRKQLTG
jgi:GAF domain